jgi:hypothetical protein
MTPEMLNLLQFAGISLAVVILKISGPRAYRAYRAYRQSQNGRDAARIN